MIDTVFKDRELKGDISTRLRQITAYADDILITARTRESLIDTFQLKNNSMEVGLIINEKKSKYLKSTKKTRNESLNINNLQIEQVQQCKYLWSIINVTQLKKKSREDSFWYIGILCKPKVFQKQIGQKAVETKIIQNCNNTNSDLYLRNMGIERSHNSDIIGL